ncbi:MAG TPA: GNAT family N-acetyltransferase [Saprospiraceae bacterium]|nr:GNAT family N-acetyltransferase [Saprospiraceae bacterium]
MDHNFAGNDKLIISCDKNLLDFDMIHQYLSQDSYWSKGIPRHVVEKAAQNSLCFGVYFNGKQIGYARIISDFASFAYLADVFVLPEYRGQGISKKLMDFIMNHEDLQGLRRWMLATLDAHGLYQQFGWKTMANPERFMEVHFPNVYQPIQ